MAGYKVNVVYKVRYKAAYITTYVIIKHKHLICYSA